MGGIRRRWKEVGGRECRRKEEVPGFHSPIHPITFQHQYKGQRSISNLNLQCLNSKRTSKYPHPFPNHIILDQTIPKIRWWRREEIQEFQCPNLQGSYGPSYLKVTFKYELDSKEGPSCLFIFEVKFLNLINT